MPDGENEIVELPQLDEPPRSGVFVDHDEIELTEDEIEQGRILGTIIDPDDDEDNGPE